jgi:hypothetical protein
MWQQWVNAILGVAIIAVPFVGLTSAAMTWTLVVIGIAVALLALWGAAYEQSGEHQARILRGS